MLFSDLEPITSGKILQLYRNRPVQNLVIDSRKVLISSGSVFFAITGDRHDGHRYIDELYELGLRQFVIEKNINPVKYNEANFLRVGSSLSALQNIVCTHRRKFNFPVIGITGSNGKTIVKEWLYQLLSADYRIVKNPGSYNSQIGVPLSVWRMDENHTLGIFEAGTSKPAEIEKLERIIKPTLGIFTNIGSAHDEGFESRFQKINEKLSLFKNTNTLLFCKNHKDIDRAIAEAHIPSFTWAVQAEADVKIEPENSGFRISYNQHSFFLSLPFSDKASLENCFHCIALMLFWGYDPVVIQQRVLALQPVSMRLELKEGINRCLLIDDTYNNDLGGLQISLDFLAGQQKKKKTIILSDVLQSGLEPKELIKKIEELVGQHHLSKVILIGKIFFETSSLFLSKEEKFFYSSTDDFLKQHDLHSFENEIILIKGARVFQFEKIILRLQRKNHGTVMEIDLSKLVHNLNWFKSKLKPGVKLMAMVKAFAYGSGSEEVAGLLQYHKVDYLGVAYTDEGVDLRKKNISIPILVMNASEESFESLLAYNLEPVMFSLKLLNRFALFLQSRKAVIHLELETGMNRLGLAESELSEAITLLKKNPNIHIASVFSHLSASDEALYDDFTKEQADRFQKMYRVVASELNIKPIRHILNSAGIIRLPDWQMEMVRLGIGLYGIDPSGEEAYSLQPAVTLKTVISQIKKIKPNETVGYGRKGKVEKEITVATLAIGYADGFSRSFSRGKGCFLVNGKKASVVGNVCMDMTMINITGIEAREGDEVIVFGNGLPIQEVAKKIETIPYEILTNTSSRVKRVFISEGI
ncbi:MAG: bifunctional UDP-N-acetylmuramoyl-tripeptide:D-alanyl-D-alanine ligase/alanine racemase [Bacteroidetes bacterium]|nr:bifunctional UDP-N-acetylmuramoyl-tripeptide:D-alanyl-D-alanine ligase/alanine racemase [Bacteroidota bacterium]